MGILQNALDEGIAELQMSATEPEEADHVAEKVGEALKDLLQEIPPQLLSQIQQQAKSGLAERRAINAEFVDRNISRWTTGLDQLELMIEIATEAGESFNARFRPSDEGRADRVFDVVSRLHARGCLVSREILCLLKNGFADGALARWRALHEIVVTVSFLSEHGQSAADSYLDYEVVDSYKAAKELNKHEERLNETGFTEDEMHSMKASYDRMIEKHGASFKDNFGWAKAFGSHNFAEMEKRVGLDQWRPYYKLASQNIHANVKAIRYSLGLSETQEDVLQAGPSNAGMTDPAHATAISLCNLTCKTILRSPDFDDVVAAKVLYLLTDTVGTAFLRCQKRGLDE